MTADAALVAIGLSALVYCLTGGADFGAGAWELFARGVDAPAQRRALSRAIAPIWEANHVWVLFALVLLLTCFPAGAAAVAEAAHVPLGLALAGIVLRGSAFAFRAHGLGSDSFRARWGIAYGISSLSTPVMLGAAVGVISSEVHGRWLAAFPLSVGLLALALFALLAATYMTCVAERELVESFRRRALLAAGASAVLAALVFALARGAAPVAHAGLVGGPWSRALVAATAAAAAGAALALAARRYRTARALAALQVAGILGAWALALDGRLVAPDVYHRAVAAPEPVLRAALIATAAGAAVLAPALALLARVVAARRS